MELHGTDLCIYALKDIVNKYRDNNSSVFMYFIYTSKVDRVNHAKLFFKMRQRWVPEYIVRILAYCYAHQLMRVKWGNKVSAPFGVSNGVSQGGILSAILFNLYMDELSECLNVCEMVV